MEQSEREMYELADLGYGRCKMIVASKPGRTLSPTRSGAWGSSGSPPSTHDREPALPRTGRQAEIVEVKGSVELAPLTGLVDAIVDLTATGTTLRENELDDQTKEIAVCTARLIANPVADKLKAERDRRARLEDRET